MKHPKHKDLRPISLLFHLRTVAERVINKQFQEELAVFTNQLAYRKSISMTDALVKLKADIERDPDSKRVIKTQALVLDFSSPFNNI